MSDSSYINEANFRYGITEYDQPCIPQYNSTLHHKKYALRDFPNNSIRDDGMPYTEHIPMPSCCTGCNKCNKIVRNHLMTNLVNIQTSINKVLTVNLYGVTKDLDKTIKMVVGNKYCVTYITERGITTVTGRLGEISTNVPDECTKYIGNFSSVATSAYIGLDCSKDGVSDKRLIYIASIRYIEQVFDKDEDQYPDLTLDEKLNEALTKITSSIKAIEEYISSNTEINDENKENNESTDSNTNNTESQTNKNCNCCDHCHEHDYYYRGPLIVGQKVPYPVTGYGPGRPGICIKDHNCNNDQTDNNKNTTEVVLSDDLLNSMSEIKQLLSSFIVEYNSTFRSDICDDCDLGVPVVSEVPHDALSKDLYVIDDETSNNDNTD